MALVRDMSRLKEAVDKAREVSDSPEEKSATRLKSLASSLAPRPNKKKELVELRAQLERAELERDSAKTRAQEGEAQLARLASAAAESAQKLSEEQQNLMARVYHVVAGKLKRMG